MCSFLSVLVTAIQSCRLLLLVFLPENKYLYLFFAFFSALRLLPTNRCWNWLRTLMSYLFCVLVFAKASEHIVCLCTSTFSACDKGYASKIVDFDHFDNYQQGNWQRECDKEERKKHKQRESQVYMLFMYYIIFLTFPLSAIHKYMPIRIIVDAVTMNYDIQMANVAYSAELISRRKLFYSSARLIY